MGYALHIHRADEWHNCDQRPIAAAEWLVVVADDPELRLDPRQGPYFALWPGSCRYPDGTWFDWSEGRVHTKNPDRATVAKMLELARKLGARVQGDHGEFYNRPNDMPSEEAFAELSDPPSRFARPKWIATGCLLVGSGLLFVLAVGLASIWHWVRG